MYEDSRPGEIFIKMSKEGSTLSGIMDGLALTVSIGLQYGVPLKVFVDKLLNTRFEPSGITANPEDSFRLFGAGLHRALARRPLHLSGLPQAQRSGATGSERGYCGRGPRADVRFRRLPAMPGSNASSTPSNAHEGAPTCSECGMLMVPNGACYKCENCGSTSGCS